MRDDSGRAYRNVVVVEVSGWICSSRYLKTMPVVKALMGFLGFPRISHDFLGFPKTSPGFYEESMRVLLGFH